MGINDHLGNFGLPPLKSSRAKKSFSNRVFLLTLENGSKVYLKQKQGVDACHREYNLLKYLDDANVPVALPMTSIAGENHFFEEQKVYCLYPVIKGKPLSSFHAANGGKKGIILGQAIARLHNALSKFDYSGEFRTLDLADSINGDYKPFLYHHKKLLDIKLIDSVLNDCHILFSSAHKLPTQVVHGDMNTNNVLFVKDIPVCYLDFEDTLVCFRLFDICYCALSILITHFDSFRQNDNWFNVFSSLIEGYKCINQLEGDEVKNLLPVVYSILLLRIAYDIALGCNNSVVHSEKILKWVSVNKNKMQRNRGYI